MGTYPEPRFSGWHPWIDVVERRVTGLGEVGTYLLARFSGSAPLEFDPTAKEIFYIGETHGRTRDLEARLKDFGRSAGFLCERSDGHYAAWRYRDRFPDDFDGKVTSPAKVHVAVCPAPPLPEAPAARGVFPLLVESMMLWQYTVRHGRLPDLNSSGGGQELRPCPDFDPALLAAVAEAIDRDDAAARLLHELAAAMGYAPTRRTWSWKEAGLVGIERHLGGLYWLQLGWAPEKRGARFWIEHKGHGHGNWFGDGADEGVACTATELQARIRLLWQRWYSEA
jgi:hypothetical protein